MIPSALRWGGFVGPVPKFAQKNGAVVVTAFLTPLLKRWRRCRLLGRAKGSPPGSPKTHAMARFLPPAPPPWAAKGRRSLELGEGRSK